MTLALFNTVSSQIVADAMLWAALAVGISITFAAVVYVLRLIR